MTLKFFWLKVWKVFEPHYRVKVVQNAIFGGFAQFSIHFGPKNAQKTTLKFWTFFGPGHLPHLWRSSKMAFQGVIFDSVSIPGENSPKNDF